MGKVHVMPEPQVQNFSRSKQILSNGNLWGGQSPHFFAAPRRYEEAAPISTRRLARFAASQFWKDSR